MKNIVFNNNNNNNNIFVNSFLAIQNPKYNI